ncbi:MAG: hypothetical protein AB8F78_13295 [Saprospiraceae bacterium]
MRDIKLDIQPYALLLKLTKRTVVQLECFIYPPPSHKMWYFMLFFIGLFASLNLEAQSVTSSTTSGDFLEFLSINDLTDAEKTLAGLPTNASGSNFDYVRFNSGESNSENGFYTIKLPLENNLTSSWIKVNYASETANHVALRGEGEYGDFVFYFVENEGANGYGYTNTKHFSIKSIDESLSEITYSIIPTDGGTTPIDAVAPNTPAEPSDESTIECAATIDVLFLRTQAADDAIAALGRFPWTFELMAEGTADHTNETLLNSKVGPKQIRAIVHPDPVHQIQYSDPGLPDDPSPCYGAISVLKTDQTIKILRQFYNADVVVYYDDQLASCGGIAGGIGVEYDDAYVLNNVYTEITWHNYLINNTHELGHIFGGYHWRNHELTEGPSPHFTMMKTGVDKGTKIEHYSNPDASYTHPDNGNTQVTGTLVKNNSQFIIQNFCRQAELETTGDLLTHIVIEPKTDKDPCDEFRFSSEVEAGNTGGPNSGPYTYEWRASTRPFFPGSSSAFSTLPNPVWTTPQPYSLWYVWLIVTPAVGEPVRVVQTVSPRCYVELPNSELIRPSGEGKIGSTFSHEVTLDYRGSVTLRSFILEENIKRNNSQGIVKLYNNTGQLVAKSMPINLGSKSDLLASSNLVPGIYHLVLESIDGSILKTKRIPLLK